MPAPEGCGSGAGLFACRKVIAPLPAPDPGRLGPPGRSASRSPARSGARLLGTADRVCGSARQPRDRVPPSDWSAGCCRSFRTSRAPGSAVPAGFPTPEPRSAGIAWTVQAQVPFAGSPFRRRW